ncbi:LysR family transcriptional regulator [Methylovulum miyakonense]|uniref:LysR family transcriptional regulator n=1 Tax=Methylovulum miyakonense TaxID=645578 RepID=UPI0003602AD9|nr:LysR family transcriptional regulator [Methylovulum miyakonense]
MDRLDLMAVFVAVAEEQSFAGGARRLDMSPPAVTRAIARLEERLKVRLLTRTTRYVRVTEAGQRYLEDARRIISAADEADEAVAGINGIPKGHLAITAPVLFGQLFVMPGIVEYLGRYPDMEVSAVFLDRVVNLLEEGFDVGIRIGELPDSSMNAIKVGHVRRVVCASPEYLAKQGIPQQPADLSQHLIVATNSASAAMEWKFAQGQTVKIKPRLTTSNNASAIEAALKNLGVARLLSYQIAPYLASGTLQSVLDRFEPERLPIHVLHREGRYASAKVRAFVDLTVANLRSQSSLNG